VFSLTDTTRIHQLLSRYYSNTTSIVPIKLDSVYQSAGLLAQSLCNQLEQHQSFRNCCKTILKEAQRFRFIQGIRIQCSGRLLGAEIAQTEVYHALGTNKSVFSKRLDYAALTALTPYGCLGIKVWICYHHDHS
jgi:small subunit ribosomal protein S3